MSVLTIDIHYLIHENFEKVRTMKPEIFTLYWRKPFSL